MRVSAAIMEIFLLYSFVMILIYEERMTKVEFFGDSNDTDLMTFAAF